SRRLCTNCGGKGEVVSRKYGVTALRRCSSCSILFRTPTDTPVEATKFYNEAYTQGPTTYRPTLEQLEIMKAYRFSNQNSDYAYLAGLLFQHRVARGARLFDYGCSWGYGSYLLDEA